MSTPKINADCLQNSDPLNHGADAWFLADSPRTRRIALVQTSIRYKFDSLLRIIDLTERAIAEEQQRHNEAMENELAKFAPETEGYGFILGFYNNDLQQASEDVPRIFRYALFSAMISVTETMFVRLTRLVQSLGANFPDFDDKKLGVIENAVSYLEDHGKVARARILSLDILPKLVAIRNCIVHNDGVIDHCKKKDAEIIKKYIDSSSSASIDEKGRANFASNFLRDHHRKLSMIILRYSNAIKRTRYS